MYLTTKAETNEVLLTYVDTGFPWKAMDWFLYSCTLVFPELEEEF